MNKQDFEKLKVDLTGHHRKSIGNLYTCNPIFLVRVNKIDWGYEEEYAEHHAIHFDESYWYSGDEFWKDHDLDDPEELEYFLQDCHGSKDVFKTKCKTWSALDLGHWLECSFKCHEYCMYHGNDRWEIINWFLTREEAEAFVKSKGGDPEINIYVDSLYRSNQFKGLLDAIIDGKLTWK